MPKDNHDSWRYINNIYVLKNKIIYFKILKKIKGSQDKKWGLVLVLAWAQIIRFYYALSATFSSPHNYNCHLLRPQNLITRIELLKLKYIYSTRTQQRGIWELNACTCVKRMAMCVASRRPLRACSHSIPTMHCMDSAT